MQARKKQDSRKAALRRFVTDNGAELFGVADIKALKEGFKLDPRLTGTLTRAISIGVPLSRVIFQDVIAQPTKHYFHHYKTCNMFLDQLGFKVVAWLQRIGFDAVAIPSSQILDWQQQTAHVSHKQIALNAGLGWIGRNNLLVNPTWGSQIRLVTVLTDMPLAPDRPSTAHCARCRACIAVCPAAAIKERPEDFDHQACFAKLKEFQSQKIVDQYICGVCLRVCAGTRKTPPKRK